jgi:hypothetical protein
MFGGEKTAFLISDDDDITILAEGLFKSLISHVGTVRLGHERGQLIAHGNLAASKSHVRRKQKENHK